MLIRLLGDGARKDGMFNQQKTKLGYKAAINIID